MIRRGVKLRSGDGWKDRERQGAIVHVYWDELPSPYGPGQHERVGCVCWTAKETEWAWGPVRLFEWPRILWLMLRDRWSGDIRKFSTRRRRNA